MSDHYQLILRSDAQASASQPRENLRDRWRRIPTLESDDGVHYRFGEADEHGVMELVFQPDAPDAEDYNSIQISIPRPWVHAKGPQVFALVFMTAEWIGWQVFDPQIDDTLQKEAVLQGMVAMRQAARERELRGEPE